MAPISTRRYETPVHEIPPILHTQPSGRTLQQHTGSLSQHRPITPHPVISGDPQTFPTLPGQLEKYLEQAKQRITHVPSTQPAPASGSVPSLNSNQILLLNPPAGTMPTVYAFHASALGMPSRVDFLHAFTRYLDEMTPNKRGKALIDSELLRRIKLILALQREGFSGYGEASSDSDSAPSTPSGTGGSWDTQAFRRWVRNTFVYRLATQTELERAIEFGLLSPPESSLSGPGVPGHLPSTGSTRSINLVFHQDRPVALRSRIYMIILRAHWITSHAGRDRTWAMVREVCSYIPKCLVYDFVAACPTCRVARSRQYEMFRGVPRGVSAAGVEKLLEFRGKSQHGFQSKIYEDDSNDGGRSPLIPPASSYGLPPGDWIPQIGPNDPFRTYPTQTPIHPLWHFHHPELDAQIVASLTSRSCHVAATPDPIFLGSLDSKSNPSSPTEARFPKPWSPGDSSGDAGAWAWVPVPGGDHEVD